VDSTSSRLFLTIAIIYHPDSGIITLFVPLRVNPYTDGFSWARREGYEKHHGIRQGEELTDEEEADV